MAYATGELSLQAKCHIRLPRERDGVEIQKIVETTIGRVIFNQAIPRIWAPSRARAWTTCSSSKWTRSWAKKQLGRIVDDCYRGPRRDHYRADAGRHQGPGLQVLHARRADRFRARYHRAAGEGDHPVQRGGRGFHNIERAFRRGRMSENERYSSVIRIWEQATNDVTQKVMDALDEFNPINMMATSRRPRFHQPRSASWPACAA